MIRTTLKLGVGTLLMAALALLGVVSSDRPLRADESNGDYSGIPPFLPNTYTAGVPNILLLLDRGGTMGMRAYCDNVNGTVTSGCPTFDETQTYGATKSDGITSIGLFDSMWCYDYDGTNKRFVNVGVQKTSISQKCGAAFWDGNFLNWVALRRMDAMKIAMIGGSCFNPGPPQVDPQITYVGRNPADGSCPKTGNPPMITMRGQDTWVIDNGDEEGINNASQPVPTAAGPGSADGRVPDDVQKGGQPVKPANLRFFVHGWSPNLSGTFCVGDAVNGSPGISSCTPSDSPGGFAESQFSIHVAVDTEPRDGVLWGLGTKARWGVMVSRGNGGAIAPVAIGNPQYRSLLGPGLTVTTYANNQIATIAAIEEWWTGKHSTPGNLLWSAMQYLGQLRSDNSYEWPLAFQYTATPTTLGYGGAMGVGNPYGGAEIAALAAEESCPTTWPDGTNITPPYIPETCGRDPWFYGSYTGLPGGGSLTWSNPASVVTCCKNAIILLTDGHQKADPGPSGFLTDYADGFHGRHCTGATSSTTLVVGTCYNGSKTSNSDPPPPGMISRAQEAALILQQHKVDYCGSCSSDLDSTAYWGHTNDLRPDIDGPLTGHIMATFWKPDGSVDHRTTIWDGAGGRGKPMPGPQTVSTYVVFAFGNIGPREALMHAAMGGGFNDHNGNQKPDLDRPDEWDEINNLTLEKVPDGIPDNYYESQSPADLIKVLQASIENILGKAASGTSVSVLSTSTTGEGAVYQAYFFPAIIENGREVDWTGALQGLFTDTFGNLREDTDGDGQLILTKDKIVKFRFTDDKKTVVDRYTDNGQGVITKVDTGLGLDKVQPIWEAGKQLALTNSGLDCPANSGGKNCRRILTWVDTDNNGIVNPDGSEVIEFTPAKAGTLCPYLGSVRTSDGHGDNPKAQNCGKAPDHGHDNGAAALQEAKKIINFVRGCEVADCGEQLATRNRQRSVVDTTVNPPTTQTKIWKLGDIMNSTPALVGAPRERYDAIYGDKDYATFFKRYKDRRQVLYAGANDGMLHAFNAGFFKQDNSQIDGTGDPVQVRFTTTPKLPGDSHDCAKLPCDNPSYDFRGDKPPLGAELWGFVPQDLLPQLQWLTSAGYDHMYYVDLKPKITDARIFANDADHPGGWGTVLIGGFGLGGSCSNCETKGLPRTVRADFGGGGHDTTRVFLSSYFVLDITNPEHDPNLLWVFRDQDLGLTTAAPAVLRVNKAGDAKTSSAHERWYVMFGSGPSDFLGSAVKDTTTDPAIVQKSTLFAVDLKRGPIYAGVNVTSDQSRTIAGITTAYDCSHSTPCILATQDASEQVQVIRVKGAPGGLKDTPAFMGDVVTLDFNFDFRADVIYAGSVVCRGGTNSPCNGSNPKWKGAMWRVTTNSGDPDPDNWARPTTLLSTFSCSDDTAACDTKVGPIVAAPTLAMDDDSNFWVYFGTGRHITSEDRLNVDGQDFFGVKDCTLNGGCDQGLERHNLYDTSKVVVCTVCAQPQTVSTDGGTSFTTDFGTLVNNVQNVDGWFTSLPKLGERNLSRATLLGGTLFFTSYVPKTDVCGFLGDGFLYALFYKSGSAYKDSAIGTNSGPDGNTVVTKSVSMGVGVPSQIAVQIGKQGDGDLGTSSNEGSVGGLTLFTQSSTGTLGQVTGQAALSPWSRLLAWRDL